MSATLVKDDRTVGTGTEAVAGKRVTVHYTGWLFDTTKPENKGRKFDSSRDRNDPFTFRLGGGEVIEGWDRGVAGMKVGGQRIIVIPPDDGFGPNGDDQLGLPANTDLIVVAELFGAY